MKFTAYEKHMESESKAFHFLLEFCWKNHQRFCPRCRHRKNYKLRDKRRRCAKCAYTFHDFSGRWINNCDLSCRQWLRIIKLFELDLTILAMSRELDLTYNTVYKAITTLRCAIAASALDAQNFFGANQGIPIRISGRMLSINRSNTINTPVFGIIEHAGVAFVDLVSGIHPETAFHFHHHFGLRLGRWGKVYFSDPFQRYGALIFCSPIPPPRFVDLTMTLSETPTVGKRSFLGFALERIRRYNGLSPEKFPLYVKELEFRFNNHHKDIFSLTAEMLCQFVPNFK